MRYRVAKKLVKRADMGGSVDERTLGTACKVYTRKGRKRWKAARKAEVAVFGQPIDIWAPTASLHLGQPEYTFLCEWPAGFGIDFVADTEGA